jgi:hypothetical protein
MGTLLPLDHEATLPRIALAIGLIILTPPGIFGLAFVVTEVIIRRRSRRA